MEVAGWRVHTYLHGDEGDDGRRKDRDHSQTGQQMSNFIDGRHLRVGRCTMRIELVPPSLILGPFGAPPREFESLSAP